jgi:hypothetical protein
MDKTLVLAGNYEQFRNWLREQELPVSNQAGFVDRPEQLTGYYSAKIIRVGEWWIGATRQSQCQATEPPAASFLNRNRVVTPLAPARECNHTDESIVRACFQVEERYRILRLETSQSDLSRRYNFFLTFSRAAPLGCYTSVI